MLRAMQKYMLQARACELNLANSISQVIFITAYNCIRRLSTTIYNALFVSAVFDLFYAVRSVRPARFFGFLRYQPILAKFCAIVILNWSNQADTTWNPSSWQPSVHADRCFHLCTRRRIFSDPLLLYRTLSHGYRTEGQGIADAAIFRP